MMSINLNICLKKYPHLTPTLPQSKIASRAANQERRLNPLKEKKILYIRGVKKTILV